jgi:nitroreductase
MGLEECFPLSGESLPSPEQVRLFLTSRRSIRGYKDRPVAREVIEKLIETACYAPSGHNDQPVYWLVIENKDTIKELASMMIDWMKLTLEEKSETAIYYAFDNMVAMWEKNRERGANFLFRGAPQVIVAHARKSSISTIPADCIIALNYLELAAYSMGLGACWNGFLMFACCQYAPINHYLNIPPDHQCYGAMMIGYPKFRYQRIPVRKKPVISWR